jgi:hypothetical protein
MPGSLATGEQVKQTRFVLLRFVVFILGAGMLTGSLGQNSA